MPDDLPPPQPRRTVVRGACPHDCPDTCALLVTVEDGRAVEVRGAPDHPPTAGVLCTKVARYLERTYSDQRVLHPMKRVGRKGEGRFERISWDEALDTIAARFRAIAASPDGAAGDPAVQLRRHDGARAVRSRWTGASSTGSARRCSTARSARPPARRAGWRRSARRWAPTSSSSSDSRLILIWGSNPIASNLHFWMRAQEAKRRGAKLVAIDPYRSATAEKCHEHVALLPGTDAALALGMMHVLIAEDLLDHDYIARYTLGFDGAQVARGGIPAGARRRDLRHPARAGDRARPRLRRRSRPAAIRLNYGMQRHAGGGNAVRAIACLPALIGAWRDPAGGALLSSSGTFPVDDRRARAPRPDPRRRRARST